MLCVPFCFSFQCHIIGEYKVKSVPNNQMQMKHVEEHPVIIKVIFYFFCLDITKCLNHLFETWAKLRKFSSTEDSYLWDQSHCEWTYGGLPLFTPSLPSPIAPIFLAPFFPSVYLSLPRSYSLSFHFCLFCPSLSPSIYISLSLSLNEVWNQNNIKENRSRSLGNLIRHCSNFRILGKIFMSDFLEYVEKCSPTDLIEWKNK